MVINNKQKFNKQQFFSFFTLFVLYFVQAMPYGFQSRYLPLVMRKQGVSLTSLGFYKLLLVPWICKFLLAAFIVDAYKTKKFWLYFSLFFLAVGSYTALFFDDDDEQQHAEYFFAKLAFVIFMLNWLSVIQDICVDWFAMNSLDKEDLGLGNTIQVGSFKLGTLFSGGLLVYLMDYLSIRQTFGIIGSIYLLCFILLLKFFNLNSKSTSSSSNQTEHDNEENQLTMKISEKIFLLHNKSPGTYWMCLFVLIYKIGEQSALNFIPLYLIDRKIPSQTIGLWTGLIGQSFSIAGSILAGVALKKTNKTISTFRWLKWLTIVRLIPMVLLTCLIIQDDVSVTNLGFILFGVIVQLFLSGYLTTITFTLMMEVSFLAPKRIQATHFSLLATCEVLGKLICQPLISMFADQFGYSAAFLLFLAFYLICLLPIYAKPKTSAAASSVSR